MASRLKGVLFDLDDTLIDWSGVTHGWREIEAERLIRVQCYIQRELPTQPLDTAVMVDLYMQRTRSAWSEARASLRAPHMPSILMRTLSELGVDCSKLSAAEVLRAYDWNVVPGTIVFADVKPILALLRAKGLKLGIVTNASQPMSMRDAELVSHDLIDYFPHCRLAAADIGFLKPHPRIFEAALDRMGTAPAETVFVGDNPVADIDGAQAAGMRAVLRLTGRTDFDPAAGRTAVRRASIAAYKRNLLDTQRSLSSLDELPAILDAWYPGWQDGGA